MNISSYKNLSKPVKLQQLERKAEAILKKMQKTGSMLKLLQKNKEPIGQKNQTMKNQTIKTLETGQKERSYVLVAGQIGAKTKTTKRQSELKYTFVAEEIVNFCRAHDWIEAGADGSYILSEAGLSYVRRQESGEEPYRAQHHIIGSRLQQMDTGVKRQLRINEAESPLGWLRKRKDKDGKPLIDDCQYEAGERLRRDFTYAQLMPRVTADWSFAADGGRQRRFAGGVQSIELRENVIAAKRRVTQALEAVGPELCSVIIDVCCHLKGLEEAEKTQGWPQRSGKVVLQIALTKLARHYGLISDTPRAEGFYTKILQWGAEDYRPDL